MKTKSRLLVVSLTLLLLLSCVTLCVSADTIAGSGVYDTRQGYFPLKLNSMTGTRASNASGTPYCIYNNVVPTGAQTTTREYHAFTLQTVVVTYNATTGNTSYPTYVYVPVSIDSYMQYPSVTTENGETIYRFPMAVLLQDSAWWSFKFEDKYQHCRFAVSIDNNKNLVVLYNPSFFSSYDVFLNSYYNQATGNLNSYMGMLYCYMANPDYNSGSYDNGYNAGYTVGYDSGKDAVQSPLGILFSGINGILSVQLFGNITMGTILYFALGLGSLFVILHFFKK